MQLPGLSHFLLKGYPPAVLLISIGNESNKVLTNLLSENFKQIEDAFQSKGKLVIVEKNRLLVW
jgi:predicted nuclease of predicted toxin-antitoxin system